MPGEVGRPGGEAGVLLDGHRPLPLHPVHEVKVAHLVVVSGADAHVVVQVVDHGAPVERVISQVWLTLIQVLV